MASRKTLLNLSTIFSVSSLALGVATLMVAMAIVDGYEKALRSSVYDVFGHFIITNPAMPIYDADAEVQRIQNQIKLPEGTKYSAFVHREVLAVNKGQLLGALVEGLDPETFMQVSSIAQRQIRVTEDNGIAHEEKKINLQDTSVAYVGKGLAKILSLQVGDSFSVVLPFSDTEGNLHRKAMRLKVQGLLDLGKYEYNNRYILTNINTARELIGFSAKASTGIRFKFKDPEAADRLQTDLLTHDFDYLTQTWKATNSSLFEAIKYEKVVLFFVLSIMIVVAAFNLTTGLYLNVYRKTMDVSVLRALGMRARQVCYIFIFQGLIIGGMGYVCGLFLGGVLTLFLNWILASGWFLPPEVYQLNSLSLVPSFWDLLFILLAAILICLVATLSPARKSMQLQPAEGLRYD